MFESAQSLRTEFAELETALSDPSVHADLAGPGEIAVHGRVGESGFELGELSAQ